MIGEVILFVFGFFGSVEFEDKSQHGVSPLWFGFDLDRPYHKGDFVSI
jgi:hypothetical protein